MRLNKLGFGALLSYSPYGHSKEEELSRSFRTAIKNDEFVRISGKQVQMSEFIAESIQKSKDSLSFAHLFEGELTLGTIPNCNCDAKKGVGQRSLGMSCSQIFLTEGSHKHRR